VTADQRVIAAREFLDAIRPYKVADRPISVLQREDAELRRMLGQVLDVVTEMAFTIEDAEDEDRDRNTSHVDVEGGIWLVSADALTAVGALEDAAEYRRRRARENRRAFTPGDPVPDVDCERADAYDALGRTLGGAR
jgi:hypothetical protein